jgi:large subunit ribosomal protein L1
MEKKDIINALNEMRKGEERKFDQSIDFIVNLQKFNIKKDAVNTVIDLPNVVKEKKICAFFEVKNNLVDTILKTDFQKYKDKKSLKKLAEKYDFFIAQASIMPAVATTFGRVLGQMGKMPSPQMGILINVEEKQLNELIKRINRALKVRTKEPSIKLVIGKLSMDNEKISENALSVYNSLLKSLPRQKDNVKNILIKTTMGKPHKIKIQ